MVYLWSTVCGLGGIVLIVFLKKTAWKAYFACVAGLMIISLMFVQRFDNYLAEHYSYKAFTERVIAIAKDDPLYFYREGDYGVTFYAGRRIPIYMKPLRREPSAFYLLCWEDEWKEIRNTNGLSLDYASDHIDRQRPERGRLYLITVHRQI